MSDTHRADDVAGNKDFGIITTEDGHRARARHMDEMTEEEVNQDIYERHNARDPSEPMDRSE